jgi:NodT family efflux transporter outer membrane factor (OMF) lipoprotein
MPLGANRRNPCRGRNGAAAVVALLLSGCAVGPNFSRPTPPPVDRYTAGPLPAALAPGTGEAAQQIVVGEKISAEWWRLFHSHPLDDAVRQALSDNQSLAAAEATLAQAQDALAQARAAFFPQIGFNASAQRQQASNSRSQVYQTPAFNVFSLGPNVSYSPDLFGGTRRHVEQEAALARYRSCELAAAYLTLTGNLITQAITVASTRRQIEVTEQILADDAKNLNLVRMEFEVGKAAETDVLSAETQLANDRAQIPPLRQQLSIARHAISVLIGKPPAAWSPPDFDMASFTLPKDLPESLPSKLVRRRPDILSAEAQLHAASAAIGVATAKLYPSITLSASVAQQALDTGALFQSSSTTWTLASGLTAPIFEGGALEAQRQGAIDAFKASLANYRQTVLQAFGQVADTLRALQHDAELLGAEHQALKLADRSLALQRLSYRTGKSNLLQLLDSERLDQQARLGYARAQAQRYQDTAQLFVAMGGGWWAEPSPGALHAIAPALGPSASPAPTPGGSGSAPSARG